MRELSLRQIDKRIDKLNAMLARKKACEFEPATMLVRKKVYKSQPMATKLAELKRKRDKLEFYIRGQQSKLDAVLKEIKFLEIAN
ncbi:MAG: hypothetical protein KZQ70_08085 [gamma proteobacterium symbiont of Lucinoma myriamae]|nr:hypothetical protein [gamma proteobacterium symbiont of Lucinoma myriamae]MCU7818336.1 hypothetical protein [gamma proteobacterium symbiont of Lucinoma myriamae]MCU7832487.1 hypothetical protein [gamma proteobacterium symbiont of Lucinoma myriamae]